MWRHSNKRDIFEPAREDLRLKILLQLADGRGKPISVRSIAAHLSVFHRVGVSFYVECAPMVKLPKKRSGNPGVPRRPKPARNCQPFSQIVVQAFTPGTQPETVKCTSNRAFLVYCSTNFSLTPPPGWGYSVNVKSTGFGAGSLAPTYTVGGPANDVITFIFSPGVTGFLTLQTECGAKATISG